jgi:hypothetical protein
MKYGNEVFMISAEKRSLALQVLEEASSLGEKAISDLSSLRIRRHGNRPQLSSTPPAVREKKQKISAKSWMVLVE